MLCSGPEDDNTTLTASAAAIQQEDADPLPPVEGQLLLAQIYLDRQQMHAAFSMIEVAARSGDAKALNMLGRAYERGWGITPNPLLALQYFEMAARQNYGWAFFNMADLYLSGQGIPRDVPRAYALYVKAAQAGVAKALNMIGLLQEDQSPSGVAAARQYYQAAADAGDCWGALNMARLALQEGDTACAQVFFHKTLETGFDACFIAMKKLLPFMPEPYRTELLARVEQRLGKQS
ncbi:tetratricopeptide repeat protein [Acetobacter ghanensis]|uniref:Sel1 repeat family protein n=1 Tax=Acetobacter ghanensis TaxID=431306 RepID=A0A0U5BFW3_9PROT|nr:tetratricopeptide repeat protein [Acetobacter ghanensis]NHO39628.1 sel1 repeat family protein [Acetobacter ghanensis]GBQ49621.1 hypothetical protein AA18895_1687 [Acetobacter ghanensis DSM 18895]CEF53655.1 hypothetical protein AGA_337 [Acetobacter ghanensis]